MFVHARELVLINLRDGEFRSLVLIKYHSIFLKLERIKRDFVTPVLICLQVLVPPGEREYHGGNIGEERIMEDHECPLAIAMDFPPAKGIKKL